MLKRKLRIALLTVAAAVPLLAADCPDFSGPPSDDESSSSSFDGSHTLISVNGHNLPVDIVYADAQNHLSLIAGTWTISGSSLSTQMTTIAYFGGVPKPSSVERHTGTIRVSGNTATGTLDDGRKITATISNGELLEDDAGNKLKFH